MAQVDHDAQAVHFADDLFAETAHTAVGGTAAGRVTDIIITIVAERHIDNAALGEVLQGLQLAVESQTVFDAKHDRFPAVALIFIQIAGGAGDAQIGLVVIDNLLDLVEDEVGIFRGACHVEIDQ